MSFSKDESSQVANLSLPCVALLPGFVVVQLLPVMLFRNRSVLQSVVDFQKSKSIYFPSTVTATESRVKRQNDDDSPDIDIEELCKDRPGDEYFRLTTEGDCRDVVR